MTNSKIDQAVKHLETMSDDDLDLCWTNIRRGVFDDCYDELVNGIPVETWIELVYLEWHDRISGLK